MSFPGPESTPPPYAQYPRPFARPPQVRIDLIGDAFQLFSKDWKIWMVATLPVVVFGGISTVLSYVLPFIERSSDPLSISPLTIISYLMSLISGILTWIAIGGMTRMAVRRIDGFAIRPSEAYQLHGNGWNYLLATIMVGLLATLGVCFFCIGVLIVGGLTLLYVPLIMLEGASAVESISRSIDLLKPHLWPAIALAFVTYLVNALGSGVVVGTFVTLPAYAITIGLLYREFFPLFNPEPAQVPGM
jgi:hypothetical protein